MPSIETILRIALPVVLAASLIEACVLSWRKPGSYNWKSMGVSMLDLAARRAIIFLPISLAEPFIALTWEHRIANIDLNDGWMIALLFLLQEFCYYWYHRAAHRVRWFWLNHSVHHSPNELNLAAAYRLGLTGRLTGTLLFFLPLVWLGVPPRVVYATLTLNLLYQFWIHAAWIPRLGVLELVLNTPSAHRVHHASNLPYLDANYGGVLIVFDRLFGTYVAERADVPCVYGWVKPMTSYNPLRVEFAQWLALWEDLRQARGLREVLGHLFAPPGWRPDGTGETTAELRERARRAGDVPTEPPARPANRGALPDAAGIG